MMANELASLIRTWIADAPSPGPAADFAMIQSGLLRASDAELEAILREFFDCEPIVVEVNEVVSARDASPSEGLRKQLVEALVFHGLDDAASAYL